ncbi:MAG: CHAD domain-containing protein [Alphaproteobacteria bacterium]|nr:CHAD domain-containing protein [Alphaproteobacteria bacterium]
MGRGATEFELKFAGAPADVAALPRSLFVRALTPAKGVWRRLETTYYDTPGRELAQAGLSLRLRIDAGRRIQTVKRPASSPVERKEYERVLGPGEVFPAPVGKKKIDAKIAGLAKGLRPTARTTVDRWTATANFGASQIEIAVDLGRAESWDGAGTAYEAPLGEVELELKAGAPRDVFELGRELAANAPLRLATRSKLEMARGLVDGGAYGLLQATAPLLAPDENAACAFRTALGALAERIALLVPHITLTRRPEGVHQMRVALRRLRALEQGLRPFLLCEDLAQLGARARNFASALGPARDWDVFLADTSLLQNANPPEGAARLKIHAETLRAAAWQNAVEAVSSADFTRFLIDLLEFTHSHELQGEAALQAPTAELAAKLLKRSWKKARRTAREVDFDVPATMHPLRLAIKRLRYQAQMARGLYDKDARAEFMTALSRLQEGLGRINDAATAGRLAEEAALGEAACGEGEAAMRAAGFISGYMAAEAGAGARYIAGEWNAIRKAKRFWRV